MNPNVPNSDPNPAETRLPVEFLLKEYDQTMQLALHESQQAEQRVKYFFTVISISSAAVGAMIQSKFLSFQDISLGIVMYILLFVGHTVLDRVLMRDIQSRKYYRDRIAIQDYFAQHDIRLSALLNTQRREVARILSERRHALLEAHRRSASLSYVVESMNAVLLFAASLWTLIVISTIETRLATLIALAVSFAYLRLIFKYGQFIKRNQFPWKHL